ncbi:YbaB/EbfC family DNA-binding protein [Amycolatopsis sp. NPDC051372]|uniref:YbaB/EbfC family DNA-binding protein n=1 Tax=Amycolatopsis sp. NPDC051372 TaxID=3155669 RepID=UPI00342779DB
MSVWKPRASRTLPRALVWRLRARFTRSGPVVGKAESHGVAVSVAPGGLLVGLAISRTALRSGSDALGSLIMELSGRATRRAGDRMNEVLSPVLEEDQLASLGYERLSEDDPDAQYS